MTSPNAIKIYYDGDCPFCSNYTKYIKLKKNIETVDLINIRNDKALYILMHERGFDLDQGMVVHYNEQYYWASDAINIIALLSEQSGILNRVNKVIFSSKLLSKLLYPFMVFVRNLTLIALGRNILKTNHTGNQKHLEDHFSIFACSWGIYSIFHFCYLLFYQNTTTPGISLLSWSFMFLAVYLVFNPRAFHVFLLLVAIQLIEMFWIMPITSNHAIIYLFFLVAMVCASFFTIAKGLTYSDYFKIIAPTGRWLLVIMYFFGIFHKINTDFLNPSSSCAVALWVEYPFPEIVKNHPFFQYSAIYGTFVIEGAIMLALFSKRFRYVAVVSGMAFHLFLGLSSFAFYGPFSFLSFALHTLFLPSTALESYKKSNIYTYACRYRWVIYSALFIWIISLCTMAYMHQLIPLIGLFAIISLPLFIFIVMFGNTPDTEPERKYLLLPNILGAVIAILFFLNNMAPYAGLKTHQSINMFANLHLEGGRSNHLVFPNPPSLFPYLNETVEISRWEVDGEEIPTLKPGREMVYYALLSAMHDVKDLKVTYIKNGKTYEDVSYHDIADEIDSYIHSKYIRKWLIFSVVDNVRPKPCDNFK